MKKILSLIAFLFISFTSIAHVFEIRAQQDPITGDITWILVSYHAFNEGGCSPSDAGLTVNGTNYQVQAVLPGDAVTIFPGSTLVAGDYNCLGVPRTYPASYVSYAAITTPNDPTNSYTVTPFSSTVCFAFCVGGTITVTPPPPPSCTGCPLTSLTATNGVPSDNGTPCTKADDTQPITFTVGHHACASNTAPSDFTIDFGGTTYGPYSYAPGVTTDVTISVAVGATDGTATVNDVDYTTCSASTSVAFPGGTFTGTPDPLLAAGAISGVDNNVDGCNANTIYIGYGPQSMDISVSPTGGTPPYTYVWTPTGPDAATNTVSPTTTTTYSVTVTDANGCTSTATNTFTVNVIDVRCGNNMNKVEVCHNTGSTTNPTNAICISPSAVPTHLASHGDCLGDCAEVNVRRTAPVANINLENGNISVFPNPATNKISIALKETGSAYQSYQITDINGRVITTQAITGDVHSDVISLDISTYAKGIYIIRAVTDDGASLTKFTVK